MRSAQATTSPSAVGGAGRFHEWLRMASSVSAHRLSGLEHHVGAVDRVVVAALEEGRQGPLGGVAGGAVAAVVAGGGGRGEGHVEADGAGDADRHLADLDGVGEPGAEVVVVGGHEDLALAGQAPEGLGVLDAVEVALEAGAEPVRLLGHGPVAGAHGRGPPRGRPAGALRLARSRARGREGPPRGGRGRRRRPP